MRVVYKFKQILHYICMFYNKVKLAAGPYSFHPFYPISFPYYWMNELTNKPFTCQQPKLTTILPCHNIRVYLLQLLYNLNCIDIMVGFNGPLVELRDFTNRAFSLLNIFQVRKKGRDLAVVDRVWVTMCHIRLKFKMVLTAAFM